jgi:hypothetical protein
MSEHLKYPCLCKNTIKMKILEKVINKEEVFSYQMLVDTISGELIKENTHIGIDINFLHVYIKSLISELIKSGNL